MKTNNQKQFIIEENPYIRSAYIVFSEIYNYTRTAQYSSDVRKSLEELIKLLYEHLNYPKISNYEIVDEIFSKKIIYKYEEGLNNDYKRI